MLVIGQFSKVCQISVKALRHYDKIGLLHPAYVDEWTGYRYYDETQIPVMLLIQRLKRYGFSLSEVRALVEDADEKQIHDWLNAQMETLNDKIRHTASIVGEIQAHLANYERTKNIMGYQDNYQVTIETAQDRPILSTRQKMGVEEFGKYYGHLFEKVAKEGVATTGLTLAIYHDDEFNRQCTDIELALEVQDPAQASRVLAGGTVATTIHKGGYSGLPDAYGALTCWIAQNGYQAVDAPYEIYLKTQFDKLPPDQWETKVFFPVKKQA